MNIYTQEFLHYYKNQPFKKKIDSPTYVGREVNSSCGDDLTVELKVENGKIIDIGYHGEGCAICEGSMSILAENLIDEKLDKLKELTKGEFLAMLGIDLTTSRQKCAMIGYNAIKGTFGGNVSG